MIRQEFITGKKDNLLLADNMQAIIATSINCNVIILIDRQSSRTMKLIGSGDAIPWADVTGQFAPDDQLGIKSNVQQILLHCLGK